MENRADNDQKKRKPFFWFVLGWMALFFMALTWSVDGLPSLFFGLASLFFFLGYWNAPRVKVSKPFDRERAQAREKAASARATYEQQTHIPPPFQSSHSTNTKKIALIVSAFIALVFISIVLPIVFSSVDTSSEEDATLGTQFYEAAQYDSAHASYKRALRKKPDNIDAITGYGNTLWYFNNVDSALQMFEKALAIDPDHEYARYRKAGVYAQTKRYDQAIIELKELLDQNPAYYDAMQLMGDIYYNRNSYEEALRWYEGAYTNGVRNRWICHLMAYLYDQKNEVPKAVPLYKEALYYDSTNIDVYVRLGELLPGKDGEFFRTRGSQLGQQ